jgi:heptaprenyl diphosphate synthase
MQIPPIEELVPIKSVWERMNLVETRLLAVTESADPFLTRIARHLLQAGGKRFRPLVAQIASEIGPARDHRSVEAGVAVELIHVGSLYHDDVIDQAETRRGAPSANSNWTNTVAILAGDFVLAKASEVAAISLGQEGVVLLAQTYAELCEGQVAELQLAHDLEHGLDEYYRVIGKKTASLIRTSARLGAMATDAAPNDIETVSEWGWECGMAFQLVDDVLDLVATDEFLGKPAGSDIGEGTFTHPVLSALASPFGAEVRDLLDGGPPYGRQAVSRVIGIVREGGFVEEAIGDAENRLRRAEKALEQLPLTDAREVLRALGAYLMGQVAKAREFA